MTEFSNPTGVTAWRELMRARQCGIVWRAKEIVKNVDPDMDRAECRNALRAAGAWLRTLPPRLALEQEDAVKVAAERCGYSPEAARRDFQEKFFRHVISVEHDPPIAEALEHRMETAVEL